MGGKLGVCREVESFSWGGDQQFFGKLICFSKLDLGFLVASTDALSRSAMISSTSSIHMVYRWSGWSSSRPSIFLRFSTTN